MGLQSHVIYEKPIGAVRLCDGIYLGDMYSARDVNFVVAHKISHVINCAGKELENDPTITRFGLKYLTFYWVDDDR